MYHQPPPYVELRVVAHSYLTVYRQGSSELEHLRTDSLVDRLVDVVVPIYS